MSYRQLDINGKPLPRKGRTSRKPAERMVRDVEMYHYEIYFSVPLLDGKRKQVRKRYWLPSDTAAMDKERELRYEPSSGKLTWAEGYRRWLDGNYPKLSPGHLSGVKSTVRRWIATFGKKSAIESTSLGVFVEWITGQAKGTKGRGAQLRHTHLLAIARWCRSRGLVKEIPFEHAPRPDAHLSKRRAATTREFLEIAALLPPQMYWMWWLLGLTGMRISAACTLLESDIKDDCFIVTTKGNKRIEYPITPKIRQVIDNAKAWKAEQGFTRPQLFCSFRGRSWAHYTFSEQLRKRASEHKITPHQLRHMVGTLMAESNLSPDIIQAGLGHDDRSSAEVYIDQTKAMRATALHAVSEAFVDVDFLYKNGSEIYKSTKNDGKRGEARMSESKEVVCPCCSCNIIITN